MARDIHSSPYDDYLQTDAAMNRGNSGGPMFNIDGDVIGINTVIFSPSGGSIGIGFALPSALARPVIEQLKANGKVERGWIGARVQPMTDELAETVGLDKARGAMIAAIDPGSPAAQAKLQPGDVILSYEGQPIERSRHLPRIIAATPPNKPVKLTLWRDGKEYEVDLKTAALDPNRPAPPPPEPEKPKPPATVDAFGLKLAKITPELRKQFSLSERAKGAVITEVPPNSAGAAQGLRPGDLVIGIGQTPLTGPEQVAQLAAAAKKANQKRVLVRIEQREGNTRFVALPTESGCAPAARSLVSHLTRPSPRRAGAGERRQTSKRFGAKRPRYPIPVPLPHRLAPAITARGTRRGSETGLGLFSDSARAEAPA